MRWLRRQRREWGCLVSWLLFCLLFFGFTAWAFRVGARPPAWDEQLPPGADVIYTDRTAEWAGVRILRLESGCLVVEEWYRHEWDLSESSAGFLGGTSGIVNGPECGAAP